MFWRSSGIRITITVMALFVLASVLVVGAIYLQTSHILAQRDMSGVIAETRSLSAIAARDGLPALQSTLRQRDYASNTMLYGLADARGKTIWLGGLVKWPDQLLHDNKTGAFAFARTKQTQTMPPQTVDTNPGLAIGATLRLPDGERLLVARDVTEHRELFHAIRNWFFAGLALLSGLAIAAGWAINRMLLGRIESMTETTSGIMAGDFTKRVPITADNDEFDALAENLNAMLERIESLMQGLREVSDNIAHDLKTPLNRLRIHAEEALRDPRGDAACREGLETTLVEADELIRTFNALLRVARLEAGTLGNNSETFEASAMLHDLAEFYEPVVEEAGAIIEIEAYEPLQLNADRQLISQAMINLIENALKYGLEAFLPAERRRVSIGVRRVTAGAELWVADHGAGIARDDYERVLKRFVRLDTARSKPGTGLGLSLVAAVVRQHGGTIELADNNPGLKVILKLPNDRLVLTTDDAGTNLGIGDKDRMSQQQLHAKTAMSDTVET